ncbi:MAG: AAA family ATPase [Prevotellaceae bacterium]|jgi:predicted ATPase|nr:AAA family ATPase [Prevotellaceae bacterium]
MSRIAIRNLGPIEKVDLDLNKVNVIMGPQSSGKSTIAKVISFCTWLDKKCSRDGRPKREEVKDYIQTLKTYHRLLNGYFNRNTQIYFIGDFIELCYNDCCPMTLDEALSWEEETYFGTVNFKFGTKYTDPIDNNSKIAYIPAERNFVSAIYNLQEYLRDKDNIQDFVTSWYEAKRKYSDSNRLNIINLGAEYYTTDQDVDVLHLQGGGNIALQVASSGLQSVVPLVTMFDYVMQGIYKERRPMSVKERDELIKKVNELVGENKEKGQHADLSILLDVINSKSYRYSQIIVEEPENNLFPLTQRDLVYYMLQMCNDAQRNHRLTLTTHSPYILYTLNSCMMGYLVSSKIPEQERQTFTNQNAWIDPKLVSIWEIEDGEIRSIQDEDGIISKNYFDLNMTALMDEYYHMLSYYDEK